MKVKCLNCGCEFETQQINTDNIGEYVTCKNCGSTFDVEKTRLEKAKELALKCKEFYKNSQLNEAGKLWEQIYDLFALEEKETVETVERKSKELFEIMKMFTDNEVYGITDYLKEKEYNIRFF